MQIYINVYIYLSGAYPEIVLSSPLAIAAAGALTSTCLYILPGELALASETDVKCRDFSVAPVCIDMK